MKDKILESLDEKVVLSLELESEYTGLNEAAMNLSDQFKPMYAELGATMFKMSEQLKPMYAEFGTTVLKSVLELSEQLKPMYAELGTTVLELSKQLKPMYADLGTTAIELSKQLKPMYADLGTTVLELSEQLKPMYLEIGTSLININENWKQNFLLSSEGFKFSNELSVSLDSLPIDLIDNINNVTKYTISQDGFNSTDFNITNFQESFDKFSENEGEINKGIWQKINDWCSYILDSPDSFKKKQPFIYIVVLIVLPFLFKMVIEPAIQDSIKEKVLNELVITEESPKKNVENVKKSLTNDFEYASVAINNIRITNRYTKVFLSNKQSSGQIGTIEINTPVIILNKKRNWSLVLYKNKNDIEVVGWVFTGNLVR